MLKKNISLKGKTVLVTGAAGFIGSNLITELLNTVEDIHIIGIDNMNDYYDVSLKEYRLQQINKCLKEVTGTFAFIRDSIANKGIIDEIFNKYKPSVIVNLAAQAGVRYSITNPDAYIESNMIGFYNIYLKHADIHMMMVKKVQHLVYASSSSVYGSNKKVP